MRGKTAQVNCHRCGDEFTARVADRERGWGKFCSKSCKATRQSYGKHAFRPKSDGTFCLSGEDRAEGSVQ